jgi:hypothetical protein
LSSNSSTKEGRKERKGKGGEGRRGEERKIELVRRGMRVSKNGKDKRDWTQEVAWKG